MIQDSEWILGRKILDLIFGYKPDTITTMTEDEILNYEYQISSNKCRDVIKANKQAFDNKFLDAISKIRDNIYKCKNKTDLGLNPISMYSDKQLYKYEEPSLSGEKNTYCFKYDEIPTIQTKGINPYTKKPLLYNIASKIGNDIRTKIITYPLNKVPYMYSSPGTCWAIPNISDPDIWFIVSNNYFKDLKELQSLHLTQNVTKNFNTSDIGKKYVYRVHIRNSLPTLGNVYHTTNIDKLEIIYNADEYDTTIGIYKIDQNIDSEAFNKLSYYVSFIGGIFTQPVLDRFAKLNIKKTIPVKVFRGMGFPNYEFLKSYHVGDEFDLYSRNSPMSWTTNICIAQFYALKYPIGMIVSAMLQPSDIIIDTRLLIEKQQLELKSGSSDLVLQSHIITIPYYKDKKEFQIPVTIESFTSGTLDISNNSLLGWKYFDGEPEKDVCILTYRLGKPISQLEATVNFINKTVDITKIPFSQKSSVTEDTLLDPITLEEVPIKDVVQFKENGELISKDVFVDLVKHNTNIWQGKMNVGFKSPLTNCIFGNLVLYNYDMSEFFPQEPGILVVNKLIKPQKLTNNGPIINNWYKITYTNLKGIPYYYASLGSPVTFYLPGVTDGTLILVLMIDCFKKGNLFGFMGGNVRFGRIHKKSELSGTYGYPDDSYLIRVAGELSDLGCTPYTLFFNRNNNSYEYIHDPYPLETNFLIQIIY